MPNVKFYDSSEVTLSVFGFLIDSGFDDGDFVKVEQDSDDFTDVKGTDGELTRSKTNDRMATVTVMLMQTSESNGKLSAVNNLDRAGSNGAGVGPFFLRDKLGTSVYSGQKCWIAGPPKEVSFGKEAKGREWKLRVMLDKRFDGGN